MPAPASIVIFLDDDGDEFPVRVGASLDLVPRDRIVEVAEAELRTMIADGTARPREPMRVFSVEAVGT